MTLEQFQKAADVSMPLAMRWFMLMTKAMAEFGIDTTRRQAAFIAQIGTESGGFDQLSESFNYSVTGLATFGGHLTPEQRASLGRQPGEKAVPSVRQQQIANLAYAGRYGNKHPGDGWLYRGRGLKQITFHDNYAACSSVLGIDAVTNPDLLLQDANAARSAGWFWQSNKCNGFADISDMVGLTHRINGGANGLADRQHRYKIAMGVLCA